MWVKTLFRAFRLAEISIAIFFHSITIKTRTNHDK